MGGHAAVWLGASLALALVVAGARADEPPASIHVGAFSQHASGLPPGWEPLRFPKIPRHTAYSVVVEDGIPVLAAESEASASGLMRRLRVDLAEHGILRWRWKIDGVVPGGDLSHKAGDDYAARVYLVFDKARSSLPFSQRVRHRLATTFYGDLPTRALSYIWGNRAPIGEVYPSPYTDFARLVVAQSGSDRSGEWVDEVHDVAADYRRAFGEEPPALVAVAIMTDSDDTGSRARAFYGDIWLMGAGAPPGSAAPAPSAGRTTSEAPPR